MATIYCALWIAEELRKREIDVWIDALHPDKPSRVEASKRAAIRAASSIVFLIDEEWERDPRTTNELSTIFEIMAEGKPKHLVPVVMGWADLPGYLREYAPLEFDGNAEDIGPFADRLAQIIRSQESLQDPERQARIDNEARARMKRIEEIVREQLIEHARHPIVVD